MDEQSIDLNKQPEGPESAPVSNRRIWYLLGIIIILAAVSWGVYNYVGRNTQPPSDQQPVTDGLDQYFTNEDKKLAPDVLPPDNIKQLLEQNMQEARDFIQTEEAKEGGNAYQGYMAVANDYRTLGDYPAAEEAYKDMITKFPEDELIYHNLGVLYEDMHQYLNAARAYTASIAKKPQELAAHLKLADLYLKHSSAQEKAKEVYLKALQDTDNHPEMLKAYASYLENTEKNLTEALLYWEEVLKKVPDNQAVKQRVEELKTKLGQ